MPVPKGKEKFAIWVHPEIKEKVKEIYKQDDCRTQSEFMEKAAKFYIGYLTAENKTNYLPNMFLSNMRNIIRESDNRHDKILFKLAVEIAMLQNLIANLNNFDPIAVERLRGDCVDEVKSINGAFRLENAIDWQDTWNR